MLPTQRFIEILIFLVLCIEVCFTMPVLNQEIPDKSILPGEFYSFRPSLETFSSEENIGYTSTIESSFLKSENIGVGNQIGEYQFSQKKEYYDFQVDGEYMYSCLHKPGNLVIFYLNITSNFSSPSILSTTSVGLGDKCWSLVVYSKNKIVYVISNTRVISYNVSDVSNPYILSFQPIEMNSKAERLPSLSEDGTCLYFCIDATVHVIDTSNPSNISMVYEEYQGLNDCQHIFPHKDYLYVSAGFEIVVMNRTNMSVIASFSPLHEVMHDYLFSAIYQSQVSEKNPNYLFVAGTRNYGGGALSVFDISNTQDIQIVYESPYDSYNAPGLSFSIDYQQDRLYLSSAIGIQIFDISNVPQVDLILTEKPDKKYKSSMARGTRIDGQFLYVLGNENKMAVGFHFGETFHDYFPASFILDISTLENRCEDCAATNLNFQKMKTRGEFAFILSDVDGGFSCCNDGKHILKNYRNRLLIFNISSSKPTFVVSYTFPTGTHVLGIAISEHESNKFVLYLGHVGHVTILEFNPYNNSNNMILERGDILAPRGDEEVIEMLLYDHDDDDMLFLFGVDYRYPTDERWDFYMHIFNISTQEFISSYMLDRSDPRYFASRILKKDDYMYFVKWDKKLVVMDISNPRSPFIKSNSLELSTSWHHDYSVSLIFYIKVDSEEYLVVSKGGIQFISITDKSNPQPIHWIVLYHNEIAGMDLLPLGFLFYTLWDGKVYGYDLSEAFKRKNFSEEYVISYSTKNAEFHKFTKFFSIQQNWMFVLDDYLAVSKNKTYFTFCSFEIGEILLTGVPNNSTDCGNNRVTLHAQDSSNNITSVSFNVLVECKMCFGIYDWDGQGIICSDHGICSMNNTCKCEENYYGENCNITSCLGEFNNDSSKFGNETACGVHGWCKEYDNCRCVLGWYQPYCDLDLSELVDLVIRINDSLSTRMDIVQYEIFDTRISLETNLETEVSMLEDEMSEVKEIFLPQMIGSLNTSLLNTFSRDMDTLKSNLESQLSSTNNDLRTDVFDEISRIDNLVETISTLLLSSCNNIPSTDSSVCSSHGLCLRFNENQEEGKCFCFEGYEGYSCVDLVPNRENEYDENLSSQKVAATVTASTFSTGIFLLLVLFIITFILFIIQCCYVFVVNLGLIGFIFYQNKEKVKKIWNDQVLRRLNGGVEDKEENGSDRNDKFACFARKRLENSISLSSSLDPSDIETKFLGDDFKIVDPNKVITEDFGTNYKDLNTMIKNGKLKKRGSLSSGFDDGEGSTIDDETSDKERTSVGGSRRVFQRRNKENSESDESESDSDGQFLSDVEEESDVHN